MDTILQQIGSFFSQIDFTSLQQMFNGIVNMVQQTAQSAGVDLGGLGQYTWLIVGMILVLIVYKLISLPFKFLINGIIGCVLLFCVNWVGGFVNFSVPINIVTALIAGFLGIPGILGILIYYILFF